MWGFNIIPIVSSLVRTGVIFFNQIIDGSLTKFMLLLLKGVILKMIDYWEYGFSVFLFSISLLFYFHISVRQGFLLAKCGKIIKFMKPIYDHKHWMTVLLLFSPNCTCFNLLVSEFLLCLFNLVIQNVLVCKKAQESLS